MQLEELVGQRLVIGIPGTVITPEIVRHFKELHAGGLILYRINFESVQQLKKLISDLENALEKKLLVFVDHEGGRVVMFSDGVTVFPDSLAIGKTENIDYARKQGEIESKELSRLGIDVNLAPVLDVLTERYSPNIGIRSYGKDWKIVSEMGAARISAMQRGGISACAKHFPGKGHAPVDAHLGLPVIHSSWREMEEVHLKPFLKAIEVGVDLVMSSHPYYPNLDPDPKKIATFSRKIIYDLLRTRLGFKKIISSDDLEMGAIKEICPIGEAGIRATESGHDLLLVCHDLNAQKSVYYALLDAYREKKLSVNELEKSVERIHHLKAKRKERFEGGAPQREPEGKRVVSQITRESVTLLTNGSRWNFRQIKDKKSLVIFPKLSSLSEKIMVEEDLLNETSFLSKEFGLFDLAPEILVVPIEPTDQQIMETEAFMERFNLIIYFCFDAHLYLSNKKLLESVQKSGKEVIVALLRNPYDIEYIHEGTHCLTNFGWRVCQIRSIIQRIFA